MHTHTHTLTHRCLADERQRKEGQRSDDDDDVVSVVPQPLPVTHDSPEKNDKKQNYPGFSKVT